MTGHLSEMELVALLDGEQDAAAAADWQPHLDGCLECRRRSVALRRESRLLGAAIAPETVQKREVRREFGWVVAAGVLLSFGVIALRRVAAGLVPPEAAGVAVLSLLSRLGFGLFRLPDYAALLTQPFIGGLVAMNLITIASLVVAARRFRPGGTAVLLAAALIPALSALPAPAEALEIRRDDGDCGVPAGEIVEDDLILMCGTAVIAGEVRGDVYYLVQSLTVSGVVEGDLIGVSERLDIEGEVGLSWRGLAQTARILGRVGRGATGAGQFLEVRPRGSIGGSAFLAGGDLILSGEVVRSLAAVGEHVDLDGAIGGDARILAEELQVGPRATVGGVLRYHGEDEPVRAAGGPEVDWVVAEPEGESPGERALDVLFRWARGLALGGVLLLLAAGPVTRVAGLGGRPLAPLLLGLLLFVGLPFAAILTALTFIGLPIAAALVGLYLFLLYASRVVAGLALGEALLGAGATPWQKLLRLALGLAIIAVLVEIPVAGTVVGLMVMFLGLGAFGLWVWNRSAGLQSGTERLA